MNNIRAIVLDLDGTLLTSGKKLSPANWTAVRQCADAGFEMIVATARPPRSVRLMCPELLDIAHRVYYNGALSANRLTGETVALPIEGGLLKQVCEYMRQEEPAAFFSVETDDTLYTSRPLTRGECASLGIRADEPIPDTAEPERFFESGVMKILLPGFGSFDRFAALFGRALHIIRTDGGTLIQLMHRSASKEEAVAKLLAPMGISSSEVMAFGDDYNDLGMFAWCGYPVAMGNAVEELKSLAWTVTAGNDDDGVALVLQRLLAQRDASVAR